MGYPCAGAPAQTQNTRSRITAYPCAWEKDGLLMIFFRPLCRQIPGVVRTMTILSVVRDFARLYETLGSTRIPKPTDQQRRSPDGTKEVHGVCRT